MVQLWAASCAPAPPAPSGRIRWSGRARQCSYGSGGRDTEFIGIPPPVCVRWHLALLNLAGAVCLKGVTRLHVATSYGYYLCQPINFDPIWLLGSRSFWIPLAPMKQVNSIEESLISKALLSVKVLRQTHQGSEYWSVVIELASVWRWDILFTSNDILFFTKRKHNR